MWLPRFAHPGSSAKDSCFILPGETLSAKPKSEQRPLRNPRDLACRADHFLHCAYGAWKRGLRPSLSHSKPHIHP